MARRTLIDRAYRLRRWLLTVTGWPTRGVKVLAVDAGGRVLLVRHRYGSGQWMLPGGGIGRGERPEEAARREVLEETGCAITEPRPVGVFQAGAEGRRDTVHLFVARVAAAPVADGLEIKEAAMIDPQALPGDVSPATRRRIEEWLGRTEAPGVAIRRW